MPAYAATNPTPRTGFGTVPNPISIPPNIFTQLSGTVPGFTANLSGAGNVIGAQLGGGLSQGTLNALKTGAAQFGTASGLGSGSGLESNELFGNIAGFSEGQQQKGIQNILSEIGTLGPTQTNPNLAAEISARNSNLAAAPDPKLAAQEQFNLWLKGAGAASAFGTPNAPWAAGGTLGPRPGFSTTHSNWGGMGGAPPGTDSLGFPNYDMSSPSYGTATVTASTPPGGWPGSPAPWGSDFAVGNPTPYGSAYGGGAFYPGMTPQEEQDILGGP